MNMNGPLVCRDAPRGKLVLAGTSVPGTSTAR